MNTEEFVPAEILKPFIKAYRIIESNEETENRVLPNTSVTIAFRFRGQNHYNTGEGKIALPAMAFSGLRKSVRLINYSKDTATLIVLFKDTGAASFFKEPFHELFEQSVALDSIIHPRELASVNELLGEARDNVQRVAIIEQFLLKRLNLYQQDDLVSEAIRQINSARGFIKIKALSNTLYISNDAFEKRFRKITGSSPKQFASITRLSSIVFQGSSKRLLDMALDAGYYDQAHFNKDFKLFTGHTPTTFFKGIAPFW